MTDHTRSQHHKHQQHDETPLENQRDLVERIARAVSEQLGFAIGVEAAPEGIHLTGIADSLAAREAAGETVATVAPGLPIKNDLVVGRPTTAIRPAFSTERNAYEEHDRPGDTQPPRDSERLSAEPAADLDPSFTDQPLETSAVDASDDDTADLLPPAEPDPTYFAPTDPVLGQDAGGSPVVIGGFSATSMASDEVDRPTTGGLGDEAIADAIRRELREDALTTDLAIDVDVVEGVAHLRGTVPVLQDTTSAAAVAGRVPGVREVVDELDITPQHR